MHVRDNPIDEGTPIMSQLNYCTLLLCLTLNCGGTLSSNEAPIEKSKIVAICVSDADCATTCEVCMTGTCGGIAAAGVICRKTAGGAATADGTSPSATCDPPEVCDGVTSACPSDVYASMGTPCGPTASLGPCDVPDQCNATGRCLARKPVGTVCKAANPANPICDPQDLCDGLRIVCPTTFAPIGTSCGGGKKCVLNGICR